MGQSIHTGGGSQGRRQSDHQLGIENRGQGHQLGIINSKFGMVFNIGDHSADGCLRASSGGGGNGEKRRQPAGQFKQSAHLFDAFAVGDLGGNDFSAVDRRAAAKGHHALAVAAVIQSQTVFDIFEGGVGLNLVKNDGIDAVGFQGA